MIEPERMLEFIKHRRSIRNFEEKVIPEKELEMILEAGRWTPSASNKQPWNFIVIKDREILSKISQKAMYGKFIKRAPVAIAIVGKIKQNPRWYVQDTSLASMNMILQAWSMGIGTCWIGAMDRDKVKTFLNLGKDDFLLTVLPMGYIKGEIPKPTLRKPLSDILRNIL